MVKYRQPPYNTFRGEVPAAAEQTALTQMLQEHNVTLIRMDRWGCDSHLVTRHDEVPLVLSVFIIQHYHELSSGDRSQRIVDGVEEPESCVCHRQRLQRGGMRHKSTAGPGLLALRGC